MVILRRRGNIRIELLPGTADAHAVAVTITPIGQADIDLALGAVTSAAIRVEDGAAASERYGVDVGATAAEVIRAALRLGSGMLAIELGIRHIRAWDGVMTEAGETAPIEPATIAMLFNEWAPASGRDPLESYGARFMRRINGLSILEPGAKKGSGASPDTAPAAAPTPAAAADS
jgi:hypothetical protein